MGPGGGFPCLCTCSPGAWNILIEEWCAAERTWAYSWWWGWT